jgi:hypothetical protein
VAGIRRGASLHSYPSRSFWSWRCSRRVKGKLSNSLKLGGLTYYKIDGLNYRHGDIENTLLELLIAAGSDKKFRKIDLKRVYFGNWLRDYCVLPIESEKDQRTLG